LSVPFIEESEYNTESLDDCYLTKKKLTV